MLVSQFSLVNKSQAAPSCAKDTGGGCDVSPARVDLSNMCVDAAVNTINWNFEEPTTTGSSGGTTCAYFDTDANDNINYSLCTRAEGGPSVRTLILYNLFQCNDSSSDNCIASAQVNGFATSCGIALSPDIFADCNASDGGNDARVSCNLSLADFGSAPKLINICSYT